MNIRIGQGYDIHAFTEGDHITLGGVRIAFDKAFKAHSDGDVLIHAVCDALLGALALGDIGKHFPDDDDHWLGVDSRKLLLMTRKVIYGHGYEIANLDCVIIAEKPKLADYIGQMRAHLAEDLNTSVERISIKATTHEKLGSLGAGEGIAALCSCLLIRGE